jgi:peptidoglycan hydrolase CwlO-like protein
MSDETSDLQTQVASLQNKLNELEGKVAALQEQLGNVQGGDDDADTSFPVSGGGP